MARRRIIDPAIWTDEKFGALSLISKLMFIGLVSIADDEGRGNASPVYIKAVLMPYDFDITPDIAKMSCLEIANTMSVLFYQENGTNKTYYQILKFTDWQTISRPSPSKIPAYDDAKMMRLFTEHSLSIHGVFTEYSLSTHAQLSEFGRKLEEKRNNCGKNAENDLIPNNALSLSVSRKDLSIKDLSIKEYDKDLKHIADANDEIDENAFIERFKTFWKLYDFKKGSKAKVQQWFKTQKISEQRLTEMLEAIKIDNEARSYAKSQGKFYPEKPYPQTWLNQRRWETILEAATNEAIQGRNGFGSDNVPHDTQTTPQSPQNADSIDIDELLNQFEKEKGNK